MSRGPGRGRTAADALEEGRATVAALEADVERLRRRAAAGERAGGALALAEYQLQGARRALAALQERTNR